MSATFREYMTLNSTIGKIAVPVFTITTANIGTEYSNIIRALVAKTDLNHIASLDWFMSHFGLNTQGGILGFTGKLRPTNSRPYVKAQSDYDWTLASEYDTRPYSALYTLPPDTQEMGMFYGTYESASYYPYSFIFAAVYNNNIFLFIAKSKLLALGTGPMAISDFDTRVSFNLSYYDGLTLETIDTEGGGTMDDYEEPTDPDSDPYSGSDGEEDPSGSGGGPGSGNQDNWDDDGDQNPIPSLPSLSAVDTGFITLYNPTVQELKNLASYLWSGLFDIDTYKKIMADPMDTILGLSIVPVNVPSSGGQAVTVGNIPTGITLTKASSQYVSVDCGSIAIDEKWHSYLDYNPYTKLSIMLPYIGSQELDIDQIQGTSLGVTYHIDVLSGACVAYITVDGNVVAEFSGQCAVSIPITGSDFTNTITSLCTLVASGIGVIATGGMSAPVSAAAITGAATAAANTAANVISGKPTFAKSGNISGSNGLMAIQKPYLILERPKLCAPGQQNTYTGYPSYITKTLSDVSGFTQVQDIHLNGISCTDTERDEILSLLRSGVIL